MQVGESAAIPCPRRGLAAFAREMFATVTLLPSLLLPPSVEGSSHVARRSRPKQTLEVTICEDFD